MTAIVYHAGYQTALRPGHRFPMSKYGYLRDALQASGLAPSHAPDPAAPSLLGLAHAPDYVARVLARDLTAAEERRIGLPLTEALAQRVRLSAAGTLLAAETALEQGLALNMAGGSHHAMRGAGAGYCVFNDVAVAAAALLAAGRAARILALDLDVHQGDGTARIFAGEPGVFTASVHAEKNFPARKAASDLDIGLADGTGDKDYLVALDDALAEIEARFAPDLIFYNAGVDVHGEDRLGRLALTDQGIRARDARVLAWARYLGAPIVGVLGGGYGDDPRIIASRHAILFEEAAKGD